MLNNRANFHGIDLPSLSGMWIGTGTCVLITLGLGIHHLLQGTESQNRIAERNAALEQLAKSRMAKACRTIRSSTPIEPGTRLPIAATQCIAVERETKVIQYVFPGVLGGQFQVIHVYTPFEVQAKESQVRSFNSLGEIR
jgi:hypothetical protein